MDKLINDRNKNCLCGNGIAFDFTAEYLSSELTSGRKIAVCSDREVSGYYYNRFEEQFLKLGIKPVLIPVDSVNSGKSFSSVEKVFKYLVDFGFGSEDWIIGLGGGGVLDVAAFSSALFDGKINLLQVPSTLNAALEVSVAQKAYLNSLGRKDRASIDIEPAAVIIDPTFYSTMPSKIKANGDAAVIRLSILSDLTLLSGLSGKEDMREYLGKLFETRTGIMRKNPTLMTLGNELALCIESYFRFMKYSEGEALALSLLATVDEKRREPLKKIYQALRLPTSVDGVSAKMLSRSMQQQLSQSKGSVVTFVDYDNSNGGMWVLRKTSILDGAAIFSKRIEKICDT